MKKHLLIALGAIALTFPLSCTSDYMNQEDDLFDQSGTDSNSDAADNPADDGSPQTDDPSTDPSTDPGTDSPDTPVVDPFAGLVTYLGDVQPILNQLCLSCHNASVHRDGVDISTYELSRINIDEILESMTEDEDDIMPPSGRVDNSILQTLAALPPTLLERVEGLEQLRVIEHGYPLRCVVTACQDHAFSGFSVDTPDDLVRAEQMLRERGLE